MFQDTIISPSLLSADFSNLAQELDAIERAGADWVHFDVIDGHFAPNLTVGIPVLKNVRKTTSLPIDVHLMIDNPLVQLPWYLECNPNFVTVHWEALGDRQQEEEAEEIVSLIHAAGCKAGIALKPDTPTGVLDSCIHLWDMILVMSVFPGFSGQSYIPESADRVRMIAEACKAKGVSPLIQVDGGIDKRTAPLVAAFGADVLVAGNAVFAQPDYTEAISSIRLGAMQALFLD